MGYKVTITIGSNSCENKLEVADTDCFVFFGISQ